MSLNCGCNPQQCSNSTAQVTLTTNGMDSVAASVSQIKNTEPYNRNQAESYSSYDQYLSFLRRPVRFTAPDISKLTIVPSPALGPMSPGQICSYPEKPLDPICPIGRVALVVGASKNTGLAVALYLRCLGYRVIGTSRHPSAYTDVATTVLSDVPLDVRSSASVKNFFDTVINPLGRLDLVVLCAGVGWAGPITDSTSDDIEAYFNLKPVGFMRCINAAVPLMRKYTQTRIVCFGNMYGSMSLGNPFFGTGANVANHALTALTQSLNVDERTLYSMDQITNPVTYITVIPSKIRTTYDSYDIGMSSSSNNSNPLVALSNIVQGASSLGLLDPYLPTTSVKLISEQVGDICLAQQPGTMYFLGNPSIVYPEFGLNYVQLQTQVNTLPSTEAVNMTTSFVDKGNHVLTVPRINELRMRMLVFFMSNRP